MDNYDDMTNPRLIQHTLETTPERTPLELALIERLQLACDEVDRMTAAVNAMRSAGCASADA